MSQGAFGTMNTQAGPSAVAGNDNQKAQNISGAFSSSTSKPTTLFGTSVMVGTKVFGPPAPNTSSASTDVVSLFGQSKAGIFGVTPPTNTNTDPPPVVTGTSTPTYCIFNEKDPSNPCVVLHYQSISAALAYRGTSLEELRVQDYEQNRKTADAGGSSRTSPGTPAVLARSLPETATVTARPANSPIFGPTTSTTVGSTRTVFPGVSASGKPALVPAPGPGSPDDQPGMLVPTKLELVEELLRNLFLGEELVDIRFHLFSAKSSTSRRVTKPRVLCANRAILARASKYFSDLTSADVNVRPLNPSLVDLMDDDDVPSSTPFDDYGYGSDSDLEDWDIPPRVPHSEAPKDRSLSNENEESSDDGSESVGSDMFFACSEQLSEDDSFAMDMAGNGASSETRVREAAHVNGLGNQSASRRRPFEGNRNVLIKDTAFRTWYALLNYVHTGKLSFLPLTSATPSGERELSGSCLEAPSCSAKSMYRLASKVGLDCLRDEARSHILSNLNEHNIMKELSCSLVPKYPELLDMELDVLYHHIASPSVIANFAAFATCITRELPHGADIVVGIHTRLLKAHHPFALKLAAPLAPLASSGPPEPKQAKANTNASDATESAPSVVPSQSASRTGLTGWTISTRGPAAGGKKKARKRNK